jgi:small subunit ribosomal protein S18
MAKHKLKISTRLLSKKVRKSAYLAQKHCRFCANPDQEVLIDYKNVNLLRAFLTERYKILPSRVSGNCFYHQRNLSKQIKLARTMALMPFCAINR